jgi:AraC-like DNA-binding protein
MANMHRGKIGPPKRLRFENGIWWYRCKFRAVEVEISSVIRSCRFKVPAVAKALGLEVRTFERVVVDSLGISPGKWLRFERIVVAQHRLNDGCSIKAVSIELGFRHQGDFGKEFKLLLGVNPTDYQRDVKRRQAVPACGGSNVKHQ